MASVGTFPVRILVQVGDNEPHELVVYHAPILKEAAPRIDIKPADGARDSGFAKDVAQSVWRHRGVIQAAYL